MFDNQLHIRAPPLRKKSRGGRGKEIEGEREGSKHFIYRGRRGWGLITPPPPSHSPGPYPYV